MLAARAQAFALSARPGIRVEKTEKMRAIIGKTFPSGAQSNEFAFREY
jgi:hypothetical protein